MKTSKLIIFSSFIVGVLLLNVGVLTSDGSMKRLLMLKNVESLANNEKDDEDFPLGQQDGAELRVKACAIGGYEYSCESCLDIKSKCNWNDEIDCKYTDGTDITEQSGTTVQNCIDYGHNFIPLSLSCNSCTRCGLTVNTGY